MGLPHRCRCVPAGNRRQVSIVYEIDDRHITVFGIVHLIPSQRRTADRSLGKRNRSPDDPVPKFRIFTTIGEVAAFDPDHGGVVSAGSMI
jgi:hypothetical protein